MKRFEHYFLNWWLTVKDVITSNVPIINIARSAFLAGWQAAQQGVQLTAAGVESDGENQDSGGN